MDRSDAHVISNPNSYEGFMVSVEFGYATSCILDPKSPMKRIYFTNTPLGFDKFNSEKIPSYDFFLHSLYTDPSYKNELQYFIKSKEKNDIDFRFPDERSFYDDLLDMYGKLLLLQSKGALIIGLESLLDNNKNKIQDVRHLIENEREL